MPKKAVDRNKEVRETKNVNQSSEAIHTNVVGLFSVQATDHEDSLFCAVFCIQTEVVLVAGYY